jgi:ABC-type amino acid transport system permease subunit
VIQLFISFYGLPSIGIRFSPLVGAVIGLGLNYAAYEARIIALESNRSREVSSMRRLHLDYTRVQTIRK